MPIRICPHCGELVDDERTNVPYCKPCDAARHRRYRQLRRQAAIGTWAKECGNAPPDQMRMLCAAIVGRLGGYDRAAAEIVAYVRELAKSGKAPAQAVKSYMAIVKLLHAAGRPE